MQQYPFDTGVNHGVNLDLPMGEQSLDELHKLFEWLLRRLPRELTVFFMVDGVYLFEREQLWSDGN